MRLGLFIVFGVAFVPFLRCMTVDEYPMWLYRYAHWVQYLPALFSLAQ